MKSNWSDLNGKIPQTDTKSTDWKRTHVGAYVCQKDCMTFDCSFFVKCLALSCFSFLYFFTWEMSVRF